MKQLKKYKTIISTVWQQAFEYRMRMFVWFLVESFPILSTIYLWFGVYGYGEQLKGYDLKTLITYYLVSYLIAVNISAHFEEDAIENINAGRISQYFTRPLSFKKHLIIGEIGWKSVYFLIVSLPIIICIVLFGQKWFILPGLSNIMLILPFLFLGFVMDSIFSFYVVIGGFFFEQAKSFNHLKWMLVELLSGAILPLSAYPESFQKVVNFLPFKFLRSVPINIYLGKIDTRTIIGLITQEAIWIVLLFFLMQFLWKKAERKYTAVGN